MAEKWPDLAEHVRLCSEGRLALAENDELGRYLVATEDLPPGRPVLTERALLAGNDAAPSLRLAANPRDAAGMAMAWERPEAGGSNPMAHFDIFSAFALHAAGEAPEISPERQKELLGRVQRWFCRPGTDDKVDREAQSEKLEMLHGALRPGVRARVSLDELRRFDDALTRNAEEFTGAPAILGAEGAGRTPFLGRRRFQGIFPCKDLIQHSCDPNVLSVAGPEEGEAGAMLRMVIQLVPLRAIAKGEQLSWCYLPYWKQLWPTQLRRHVLQECWHFVCRCPRCAGPAQERVMAFKCPACGRGELCPQAPCAAPDVDAGHGGALAAVQALACGACSLKLARGDPHGPHAGYAERCLSLEAAAFRAPWRGVLGRDLEAAGPLDLLASTHWLLSDHASHELENAPAILDARAMAGDGADIGAVEEFLRRQAANAELVAQALVRLIGHERSVGIIIDIIVIVINIIMIIRIVVIISISSSSCHYF